MNEREERVQEAIFESNTADLWEILDGFSRGKSFLLIYLRKKDAPMKVGDIATGFGVTPARVSSLIRCLEFERLLHRTKRKIDYRSTYVELTDKGKQRADEIIATQRSVIHRLIEKVGIDVLERFLEDASAIQAAVLEITKENSSCCN